jgi:hypothetical protein
LEKIRESVHGASGTIAGEQDDAGATEQLDRPPGRGAGPKQADWQMQMDDLRSQVQALEARLEKLESLVS